MTDADRKQYRFYLVVILVPLILIPYASYFLIPKSDYQLCIEAQVASFESLRVNNPEQFRTRMCKGSKCKTTAEHEGYAARECFLLQRNIYN